MGVSTDADIAFGIDLNEDMYNMPWYDEEKYEEEMDIEDLFYGWCEKEFGKDNAPFELIIHCSYECPMYILAMKGTNQSASRGCAQEFNPNELIEQSSGDKAQEYKMAIEKYNIKGEDDVTNPSWLLFSLWG
jgi:hypothetical protein